jgi:hypothetical protein
MNCLSFVFPALAACLLLGVARGADEAESPPNVVLIRPAAEPVPALKYRLLPERRELIPGNAAIFYHRAIEDQYQKHYRQALQARFAKKPPGEATADEEAHGVWLTQPLASLPRDKVNEYLTAHASSLHEVELGARREFCNWEFQHRDEGFNLLIEDIQQVRGLARLLILKIRFEIVEGRVDSALHWIRTGVVLARHVNESTTLIQSLIASAITTQMAGTLEEFVQMAGAPNLYWALANLPRPFIDISQAMEGEKYVLEKEFPQLKTLDSGPWNLEQARAFSDELQKKMAMLTDDWARVSSPSSRPEMKDLGEHLLFTALMARAYPEAKRALIARGRSSADVEAMPTIQVVALYSYNLYEEARDDIFKWGGLPYWQGHRGLREAGQHPRLGWAKLKAGIPFATLLPAINSVFVVPVRTQRRLDVVQYIEAIRLYAANHGSKLPADLAAITESPVPIDPATNRPLDYKLDGDTATLTAPAPPGWDGIPQYKIRYELKLAK